MNLQVKHCNTWYEVSKEGIAEREKQDCHYHEPGADEDWVYIDESSIWSKAYYNDDIIYHVQPGWLYIGWAYHNFEMPPLVAEYIKEEEAKYRTSYTYHEEKPKDGIPKAGIDFMLYEDFVDISINSCNDNCLNKYNISYEDFVFDQLKDFYIGDEEINKEAFLKEMSDHEEITDYYENYHNNSRSLDLESFTDKRSLPPTSSAPLMKKTSKSQISHKPWDDKKYMHELNSPEDWIYLNNYKGYWDNGIYYPETKAGWLYRGYLYHENESAPFKQYIHETCPELPIPGLDFMPTEENEYKDFYPSSSEGMEWIDTIRSNFY